MSEKIICPLRFGSPNNKCVSNCAWYSGSDINPQCAILKISFCLTSIDETYNKLTFDHYHEND